MSVFRDDHDVELDQQALDSIYARGKARNDVYSNPGLFTGIGQTWKSPLIGFKVGTDSTGKMIGDAIAKTNEIFAESQYASKLSFEALIGTDKALYESRMAWSQDVRDRGEAGLAKTIEQGASWYKGPAGEGTQILRGLTEMIPRAVVGGRAFGSLGGGLFLAKPEGDKTEIQLKQQGVDAETAAMAGNLTTVSLAAMSYLPASGFNKSLLADLGLSIGGNVAIGMTQREAMNQALEQYPEIASQYRAADGSAIALDVLLGSAFFGFSRAGMTPTPEQKSNLVDDALTVKAVDQSGNVEGMKPTAKGDVKIVQRNKERGLEALMTDKPMPEPEPIKTPWEEIEAQADIAGQKRLAEEISAAVIRGDIYTPKMESDLPLPPVKQGAPESFTNDNLVMQAGHRPDLITNPEAYAGLEKFIVQLESNGKASAKALTSSATGLHQFTKDTWLGTVRQAAPAWANGLDDKALLALRTDPAKSAEMFKSLTETNAADLQKNMLPVNYHNVYAMHHFGPSGGKRFARSGSNVPMDAILTDEQIKANKYLAGKTKAEAIAIWEKRASDAGVPGETVFMDPRYNSDKWFHPNGVMKGIPETNGAEADGLNSRLSEIRATNADGTDRVHAGVRPIDSRYLPNDAAESLRAFTEATGAEVTLFRNLSPEVRDFNGATLPGENRIFLNESSKHPLVTVTMHEWTHRLEAEHPDLHGELIGEMNRQKADIAKYGQDRGFAPDKAVRELIGDAAGDAAADPSFWKRMAKDNPNAFTKLANTFMKYLDGLLQKIGYGSNRYVKDVEGFRNTLARVMDVHQQRTNPNDPRRVVQLLEQEIGWAQVGGDLIGRSGMDDGVNGQGGGFQVDGKTSWQAKNRFDTNAESTFWKERPKGITEAQARSAMAKLKDGKPLDGPNEKRFIKYAEKEMAARDAERSAADEAFMAEQDAVAFSDKEPEAGAKLRARWESNFDAVLKDYSKLKDSNGGKVLNTDIARELSPEYLADRTKSADVHSAASDFIKEVYRRKLAEPTPDGLQRGVILSAGGTGAGKTTGLDAVLGELGNPEIVYDTNMNTLDSAVTKIDQAIASDRAVNILYTYRDPVEALVMGALKRANRQAEEFGTGRTVPLPEHLKTHVGASRVVRQLIEKYQDNPLVEFTFIDNSRGKNNAQVVDSIDALPKVEENGLYEKLDQALEAEYAAGKISESIYKGFKTRTNERPSNGRDSGGKPAKQDQVNFSDKFDDFEPLEVLPEASPEEAAVVARANINPNAEVNFGADIDGKPTDNLADAVAMIQKQREADEARAAKFVKVAKAVLSGGKVAKADRSIGDAIATKYRDLMRLDAEFAGLTNGERIARAAEEAGTDAKMMAIKAAQRRALNLAAQLENSARIKERAPDLNEKHKFHAALAERLGQLDGRIRGEQAAARAGMMDVLEAAEPNWLGLVQDDAAVLGLAKEVMGESSGDPRLAKAAKAMQDGFEKLRVTANSLGANIGKLDYGYLPHHWDVGLLMHGGKSLAERTALKMQGKAYTVADAKGDYVKDMMEHGNRDALRNEDGTVMDDAEATEFYTATFETLFTEGRNKADYTTGGKGSRASKHDGKHRVIHFKSAESYIAMMNKYGTGTLLDAVMAHADRMAKDIALMDEFGSNPASTFELLKTQAERYDNATGVMSGGATNDMIWKVLNGELGTPVNMTLAKIGQGARNWVTATALQGVTLSSITDAPLQSLVAKSYGLDLGKNLKNSLAAFGGDTAKEAARLGLVTDYMGSEMALWGQDNVAASSTGKLAEATMRLTGVNRWTYSMRRGAELTLSMGITDWLPKGWDQLEAKTLENFKQSGITKADWEIWQQAGLSEFKGNAMLTHAEIAKVDHPQAGRAAARYLGLLDDFGKLAVFAPDVRTRAALTQGTQAGTVGGEFARSMMLFKSFALGMPMRHIRRLRQMDGKSRAEYAMAYMVGLAAFGALALQLKQIAYGKDPLDMTEGKFWLAAAAQGGGLGILYDIIYKGLDAEGKTGRQNYRGALGPVFGRAYDIGELGYEGMFAAAGSKQHAKQFREHSARFISDNTPFTKIWWYKQAVDQAVGHEMRDLISPGYSKKVEQRAAKYGESYYISPDGDVRAPDFEKAVGE